MHRTIRFALLAIARLAVGVSGSSAASPTTTPTKQEVARQMLGSRAGQLLTSPAGAYMESVARGDHRLAPDSSGIPAREGLKVAAAKSTGGSSLVNVRVNNPANDTHQTDQTTQSETSVAVSGQNVAVGYNTSQHALLLLTAGGDLSGYGYSTDGGQTFTDGGAIPNARGNVNLRDPWLAGDPGAARYHTRLTMQGCERNVP